MAAITSGAESAREMAGAWAEGAENVPGGRQVGERTEVMAGEGMVVWNGVRAWRAGTGRRTSGREDTNSACASSETSPSGTPHASGIRCAIPYSSGTEDENRGAG